MTRSREGEVKRDQQQDEEDAREGQEHIGETHEQTVQPAGTQPGCQPMSRCPGDGDQDTDPAHQQTDPRPVDQTGQDVTPVNIGAQRVAPAGRLQDKVGRPEGHGIPGSKPGGPDAHQQKKQGDDQARPLHEGTSAPVPHTHPRIGRRYSRSASSEPSTTITAAVRVVAMTTG